MPPATLAWGPPRNPLSPFSTAPPPPCALRSIQVTTDKKLQAVPLGGLGEFGMNIMALRYGDDIIVIDCGMMFPEDELLGVDVVTPDLTFLRENQQHVRALILTHGHEDH